MLSNIPDNHFNDTLKQEPQNKAQPKKGDLNGGLDAWLTLARELTRSMLTNESKSSSNGAPSAGSGNL